MTPRQNFISLAVKRIALQHELLIQEQISIAAILIVSVDVEHRPEIVKLVRRVQSKQRAQTLFTHAAICFLTRADVQIFLRKLIVGNEGDFVVAIALGTCRNYPQPCRRKTIQQQRLKMRGRSGHVICQRKFVISVSACIIIHAPKFLERINRHHVAVCVDVKIILRDHVLKIRFDLDKRQIQFGDNFFGALKDFLLDAGSISIQPVNTADVKNRYVRQILIRVIGIQMLEYGMKAVYAARKSGSNPPLSVFAKGNLSSGGAMSA